MLLLTLLTLFPFFYLHSYKRFDGDKEADAKAAKVSVRDGWEIAQIEFVVYCRLTTETDS